MPKSKPAAPQPSPSPCRRAAGGSEVGAWGLPVHRPAAVAILIDLQPSSKHHTRRTMKKINSVSIKGFRSLADVELTDLPNVAVMVGANGSGKSNFLRFFEMLKSMMNDEGLGRFVASQGRANDQLHGGPEVTQQIEAQLSFGNDNDNYDYRFGLEYVLSDRFIFFEEAFKFKRSEQKLPLNHAEREAGRVNLGSDDEWRNLEFWHQLGKGHEEANILDYRCDNDASTNSNKGSCSPECLAAKEIVNFFKNSPVYQFQNTSLASRMKASCYVGDNFALRHDGGNLSSVLFRLENEFGRQYRSVCRDIGQILPVFDKFAIEEKDEMTILQWESLFLDKIFGAGLTSDGSLRLFALVTLLNLPPEMLPNVIFLDEPELGLHPAAISLLGDIISGLSQDRQVLLATQSPLLVDEVGLDEVIVFDLEKERTHIRQLEAKEYAHWLEKYSTGQLWQKNVIGGRP